ncbi:hypothetical protein IQ268_15825, partial [Oculatella sp. LEGE 06141]|uniref:hypothetical protein n=1 Tax=Oculatella sp. LEGE 06141 TaxID=1828648 RepID=UPI0019FBCD39
PPPPPPLRLVPPPPPVAAPPPPVAAPAAGAAVGAEAAAGAGISTTAVTVTGVAAIVAIMVVAGIQLWQLARFQEALRAEGYIILENPLGLCIGGCHLPSRPIRPAFPDFPFEPISPFPAPRLPSPPPDAIIEWLRSQPRSPTQPQPHPQPHPQPQPQPETTRRRRQQCLERNPTFLVCEDEVDMEEAVVNFLLDQGYGPEDLGDCRGVGSFASGAIDACDAAPGERWHCRVSGGNEVSIFGCLCCREDGTTSYEWRSPHWSINLSRRRPRR